MHKHDTNKQQSKQIQASFLDLPTISTKEFSIYSPLKSKKNSDINVFFSPKGNKTVKDVSKNNDISKWSRKISLEPSKDRKIFNYSNTISKELAEVKQYLMPNIDKETPVLETSRLISLLKPKDTDF